MPRVLEEIRAAESAFGDEGRVLVRASGTEPKIRVMVEAARAEQVDCWTARLAAVIQERLAG